jgi:hypothetical protein
MTIAQCARRLAWPAVYAAVFGFVLSVNQLDVSAADQPLTEHQVKAAFLFNFAKFVTWPTDTFPDQNAPLVIGIAGDDPFGDAIDEITRGERVNGHPIVVKRLGADDQLGRCQILFVSSSERKRLRKILESLGNAPVLTVGEPDDFALLGGVIRFTKNQYRVGFEINIDAAERSGLRISSKLLSLARIVSAAKPERTQ